MPEAGSRLASREEAVAVRCLKGTLSEAATLAGSSSHCKATSTDLRARLLPLGSFKEEALVGRNSAEGH